MNILMDRIEQLAMTKYFFLNEHGSKLIRKKFVSRLHDNATSLSIIKNWLKRFKSDDLSCGDEERPGTLLISSRPALQRFPKKFPFASAQIMAGHFSVDRELGLRKFTRNWGHGLSAEPKMTRATESQSLLTIAIKPVEITFQGIIAEDKSWFSYLIESEAMCISDPAEVTPTVRASIPGKSSDYTFPRQTVD
jgi:hypothetical protein